MQITGYHGTSVDNANNIVSNGFTISAGDEHWIGDGIYFFIKGLFKNPDESAKKWAIANSWDNDSKKHKYSNYGTIEANISIDEDTFWDLTSSDGIETFNYLRDKYVEAISKAGKRLKDKDFKDGHIINKAVNDGFFSPSAIKADFYIKFTTERIFTINFRIPNCTILALRNNNCIEKERLKIKDKGQIQ